MWDPNEFYEPALGFRITKPAGWTFLPPAWTPAAQLRYGQWLKHSNLPFVSMIKEHDRPLHVKPNVQANARPMDGVPPFAGRRENLEGAVAIFRQMFTHFELLEMAPALTISGHPATLLRSTFLMQGPDPSLMLFEVDSRSYEIFTPRAKFTVAMATTTDPRYAAQDDLAAVLASIRC